MPAEEQTNPLELMSEHKGHMEGAGPQIQNLPRPRNPIGLQPKGMFVLVRRLPNEKTTSSGFLFLPEKQGEKELFAEIIAVGEGRTHINGNYQPATACSVGDHVVVRQYAGTRIPDWMVLPNDDGTKDEYAVMNGQNIEGRKISAPWPGDVVAASK